MNARIVRHALLIALAIGPLPAIAATPPPPSSGAPAPALAAATTWPREVKLSSAGILIYQPQVNSWTDNRIDFRCAMAILPKGATREDFGVVFATARTRVDKTTRRVVLDDLKITKSDFPTLPDHGAAYLAELQKRFAQGVRTVSLDQLKQSPALAATSAPAAAVQSNVPKVIVSNSPAILVPIDGPPVLRPVPGVAGFQRVINTKALILQRAVEKDFFIHVFDGWMTAPAIQGPWSPVFIAPSGINPAATKVSAARVVDMLDGGPAANPKPSLAAGAPAIYTTQVPTELIVFNGTPDFVPIVGTALLWASNTTSDVLRDSTSNDYYVLLAGRWFRASALNGQWTSVASNALPPDFAKIPPASLAGAVLMTVAGTPQAQQALNENSIAQTAQVPRRNGPKFAPKFDGAPQYGPIAGTSLKYVINASAPVIQVSTDAYYAVRAGVWFTATQVTGPWTVATSVPEAIYSIPPSSPIYFVTFVRIYEVTPDVVHEGYTPGYLGTTVSPWGTVVYGTGYSYMSWIGNAWYPAPSTYGVAAAPVYNQGAGYTYAFAVGLATPAWTAALPERRVFFTRLLGRLPVLRNRGDQCLSPAQQRGQRQRAQRERQQCGSCPDDRRRVARLRPDACQPRRQPSWYGTRQRRIRIRRRPFRTVGAVAAVFAAQRLLRRPRRQPLSPGQRRLAAAIGRKLGQCIERHDLGRSGSQRAQQQQYPTRGGQLRHEQHRPLQRCAEHRLERAGPGRWRLQPDARRQRRHQFAVLQLLERRAGQRRGHVVERRIHLFRRQLVLRRLRLGRALSLTGTKLFRSRPRAGGNGRRATRRCPEPGPGFPRRPICR